MASAGLQNPPISHERRKRVFVRKNSCARQVSDLLGNSVATHSQWRRKLRNNSGNKVNKICRKRIAPTIFLRGGSATDPLNLRCMDDPDIDRLMNAVTPKSSPLPTPRHRVDTYEVPELDPTDPLLLKSTPVQSSKKRRRKRKASSPEGPDAKNAKMGEMPPTDSSGRPMKLSHRLKSLSHQRREEIVSPVVPQPGEWRNKKLVSLAVKTAAAAPDKKDSAYRYGNYDRYYGYRFKRDGNGDPRLTFLQPELFEGKDLLDIGCNSGELTIAMTLLGARTAVGLDIDSDLISRANKNKKLFVNGERCIVLSEEQEKTLRAKNHNLSNLLFVSGDYVLKEDCMLASQKELFDVITCMSVTKWIHLNHGDAGLKRAFRRMYAQLRPGGMLILEPQMYNSYTLKKNVTSETLENFKKMKFYPEQFMAFLLNKVGFSELDIIGTPTDLSRGFQRPIYKLMKKKR